MIRHLTCLLTLIIPISSIAAQQLDNTAPIKWATYTDAGVGFGVSLPKLPLRYYSSDFCSDNEEFSYFAYADEVVYKVSIRRKTIVAFGCQPKAVFSSTAEFNRIAGLNQLPVEQANGGLKLVKLRKDDSVSWFLDDPGKTQLIELSIFHRAGAKIEETKFLRSFYIGVEPGGMPIGDGSGQVLGDTGTPQDRSKQTADIGFETELIPHRVLHQPKARYTNEAKDREVEGGVLLKITLLANGTVGNVLVVKELGFGLTEQAVRAARQIVFLPRKKNGVNVPVIVSREYSFTIY